jgi:hypothetical protein
LAFFQLVGTASICLPKYRPSEASPLVWCVYIVATGCENTAVSPPLSPCGMLFACMESPLEAGFGLCGAKLHVSLTFDRKHQQPRSTNHAHASGSRTTRENQQDQDQISTNSGGFFLRASLSHETPCAELGSKACAGAGIAAVLCVACYAPKQIEGFFPHLRPVSF